MRYPKVTFFKFTTTSYMYYDLYSECELYCSNAFTDKQGVHKFMVVSLALPHTIPSTE